MANYEGSCLCGEVRYLIEADDAKFYHCHCQRCRKATGTGHASNLLLMKAERAEWLTGEDNISRYKVPEAKRFANHFCKTCGSRLPRIGAAGEMVVIPAGTLDHEIEVQPQARIFWDSKSDWSCGLEPIATYSEYPAS